MKEKLKWLLPLLAGILFVLPVLALYKRFGMSVVVEVLFCSILMIAVILIGAMLISYGIIRYYRDDRENR